jgi:membrane protease FtsH catalytic subunit (EC 3.4.24.-)
VHKVTIVPRGRAGGYVMSLPEDDVFLRSREEFEDYIAAAMGGRAAEEIIFNRLTTGASSDLQQATGMARSMVTQFGMSDLLGPRTFGSGGGSLFLGREMFEQRDYSEHAAEQIDDEVKRIVETAYNRAKSILVEKPRQAAQAGQRAHRAGKRSTARPSRRSWPTQRPRRPTWTPRPPWGD